jgi:hypothetical protein
VKGDSGIERVARRVKVAVKNALDLQGQKQVSIIGGPARGIKMTLDLDGQTPMYLGMFEWELHRFFRAALAGANLVFDLGGYVGYDALMFAANSSGRVITFEPDGQRTRVIAENLAANPQLAGRVTIVSDAVGRRDGAGVTTLDTFSRSEGEPDFIKIDIDGDELEALEGAMNVLRGRRPHLVVETHSLELERQCGRVLVECGYRPVIKHNRRVWREHRGGTPHNRWLLATGLPLVRG